MSNVVLTFTVSTCTSHGLALAHKSLPVIAMACIKRRCSVIFHENEFVWTRSASLALLGKKTARSVARIQCLSNPSTCL